MRKTSATPSKLEASVWVKTLGDYRKSGADYEHYLLPQIYGGSRPLFGVEKWLRAANILPPDMYVVPGSRAELDSYGNFKHGQWTKILSALGAAEHSAGYSANRTMRSVGRRGLGGKRKGRLTEYFAGRPKPGWPMGIWQKVGKTALRPILIFVRKPQYRRIYDFYGVAKIVSDREFGPILRRELQRATATLPLPIAA